MNTLSANHYICPPGYGVTRFLDQALRSGFEAVGLTRAALDAHAMPALKAELAARDLAVSSLNSAGYFTWADPARRRQQDEANRKLIDAAAEIGARTLCVITGGMADLGSVAEARARTADGLARLDALAARAGIWLGLEPIHPAGIAAKGIVNTITQARALIAPLHATGLILDLSHSWWDPDWADSLADPGARVRLVQLCNVLLSETQLPRRSPELDRGVLDMGAVVEDLRQRGYTGALEFELFAADHAEPDIAPLLDAAAAVLRRVTGANPI